MYGVRVRHPGMLICAFVASVAFAQTSSTITGLVTDQSGLPVAEVRITVTGTANGVRTTTLTNAEGYYTVASIPSAGYRVTAALAGFNEASSTLRVDAGAVARLDLVLVPGDNKQVVEVQADVPALETQVGMLSNSVDVTEIEGLPVPSRNVLALAMMLPGVAGEFVGDEAGVFQDVPTNGAGMTIAGGRAGSSAILADGASSTSVGIGRGTVTFSPETIQEVQVITSTFSARYGVSGGGIVNTVSRPGTDQLRTTLYWYHRNPVLNARQFNRPLPSQVRRNELGVTSGGPVVIPKIYNGRKRTFFFAAFEPKRWFDAVEIYARFPTLVERNGDFRNSYVAPGQRRPLLYQQVRCSPSPQDCRQLLPMHRPSSTAEYPLFNLNHPDPGRRGLVIPPEYIDPLAKKILEGVPLPNRPYDAQGYNFYSTRGVNAGSNRLNLKLDHGLTGSNRLSLRYTDVPNLADRYRVDKTTLFNSLASDRSVTRQVLLNDTHTVTARIVNEFRASYTYADYSRLLPGDLATNNYTKQMFDLPNQTDWGYPRFNTGLGDYGYIGSAPGSYIEHQYQMADDVTMVRGPHTLSVGMDWRLLMLNSKATGLQDICCGTYAWAAAQTNSGNTLTPGGTGGMQFASFLLGVPNSVSLRGVLIPYYYRWKVGAAYFQDDWKVRRNFTLNLGVRWQYNGPRSEKFNRQASVDPFHPVEIANAAGQVTRITVNYLYSGFEGRSIYLEPAHKRNFEPRIGFAWVPRLGRLVREKLVIRGGYGISHTPTTGRGRNPLPDFGAGSSGSWGYTRWANNNANPPLTQGRAGGSYLIGIGRNQPVVRVNPAVLQIPSNGVLCQNCPPAQDARLPGGALVYFSSASASPYVQNWNFTTETQLRGGFVIRLSYMGAKGTHLYSPLVPLNNPDPAAYEEILNEGGDPSELIPDPFGRVDTAGNILNIPRVNLLRPIPTVGDINIAGLTNSTSIYHAGAFSLERRFVRGLSVRANYTWSKSIDTSSDADLAGSNLYAWGATRLQDPEDLKANRSVSSFDTRHRMNLAVIAELPFGRRRRFFTDAPRLVNALESNWSVSLLGSIFSGFPFAPYLGDANGLPGGATGGELIRPDIIPGVPPINPRWSKNVANDVPYFNPEAFGRPLFGHLGTAPRTLDYARVPWKQSFNLSLSRDFRPFDDRRRSLQFRAEAYNVLNRATFTTSGANNESPNLFSSTPALSRTGLSLAGPMPYLVGLGGRDFPVGTRENLLAAAYNQNFAKLWRDRNGPGRILQLGLRIYF